MNQNVNYWWFFLVTGLIMIGISIWIFILPEEAHISLSFLFAIGILIPSCLETWFALTSRKSIGGWVWSLAGGVFDLVIGVYLLMYPLVTFTVLPLIFGFWLLFKGLSAIGLSLVMKSHHSVNWGWLFTIGILVTFFGVLVVIVPAFGVVNIIIWTGLTFALAELFRVLLALRLRSLAQ